MTRTVSTPGRADPGTGDPWHGFRGPVWRDTIDPRRFLQDNYTP
jgi:hypothetical protein